LLDCTSSPLPPATKKSSRKISGGEKELAPRTNARLGSCSNRTITARPSSASAAIGPGPGRSVQTAVAVAPLPPERRAPPIIARVRTAAATHRIIDEEMGTGSGGKALRRMPGTSATLPRSTTRSPPPATRRMKMDLTGQAPLAVLGDNKGA
jgi:hypothetical protein